MINIEATVHIAVSGIANNNLPIISSKNTVIKKPPIIKLYHLYIGYFVEICHDIFYFTYFVIGILEYVCIYPSLFILKPIFFNKLVLSSIDNFCLFIKLTTSLS